MSDKKTPNITVLLGGGKSDPDAELMRKAKQELETYAQKMQVKAQAKKIEYNSYIEAGFTPEQALILVK